MSVTSSGKIDGRDVKFTYTRSINIDEAKLSWTSDDTHKQESSPQGHEIASKDVIAAFYSDHTGSSGEFKVLYVVEQAATATKTKTSPVKLKTLVASGLPQDFIHDFSIPPPKAFPGSHSEHPTPSDGTNVHIVVSSGSGIGLAFPVWEQLVKPLLDTLSLHQDRDYTLHLTQSETSITELTTSLLLPTANRGQPQTIVLLSGDGGIVDILNSLLSTPHSPSYLNPTLILLPLGTGNALAHSTGIGADSTLGLRTWLSGKSANLPFFTASFSPGARAVADYGQSTLPLPFQISKPASPTGPSVPVAHGAVVCSWGLHAGLVADSDTVEFREFGAERFKMAAKEALFPSDGGGPHAYKGRVRVRRRGEGGWEEIREGEHAYVVVTLVGQLEKGFEISPASRPMDGKLRVVHFGPVSGEVAMEVMGGAYRGGKHVEDERVGYEEIEALRIDFAENEGRWRRVCVDGKIVRVEEGGWVEVRAGKERVLDLVVPKDVVNVG